MEKLKENELKNIRTILKLSEELLNSDLDQISQFICSKVAFNLNSLLTNDMESLLQHTEQT